MNGWRKKWGTLRAYCRGNAVATSDKQSHPISGYDRLALVWRANATGWQVGNGREAETHQVKWSRRCACQGNMNSHRVNYDPALWHHKLLAWQFARARLCYHISARQKQEGNIKNSEKACKCSRILWTPLSNVSIQNIFYKQQISNLI